MKDFKLNQLTELLNFTNAYADRVNGKVTTFSNDNNVVNFADMKITDSNRDQVLAETKKQAELFAKSRNSKATSPKSFSYASREEQTIRDQVKQWLERRKLRGHGKRDQK